MLKNSTPLVEGDDEEDKDMEDVQEELEEKDDIMDHTSRAIGDRTTNRNTNS